MPPCGASLPVSQAPAFLTSAATSMPSENQSRIVCARRISSAMRGVLALISAWSVAALSSADKIGSVEFLRTDCARYRQHHDPLVRSQLDSLPFQITLADILRRYSPEHQEHRRLSDEAYGWPVLYILDGQLYGDKYVSPSGTYLVPGDDVARRRAARAQ